MKRIVAALIICILCIPMFSVMVPRASAVVEAGVYTNPVLPGYGFIDFEEGTDGQVIRSTLPGLKFTTTLGYDWVYGDVRTGAYNARSLTDPSVNHGEYVVNGYFFAWLGPNMGEGRIDFVNGPASYLSVLTSTYSGLSIDAYDSNDNLLATSGWANGNLGTYAFTRLTVMAPNMAYVIIHDTGNYWLLDDLVTDAGGQRGLGPGPVFTCIHISSDRLIIFETPGQSSNIVATVSDQLGNPMSGVTVYFTSSQGALSSPSAKTDNQGKSTVTLSPSSSTTSPVVATVSAEANGVSVSTFVIFYPPGAPATSWNTCPQFNIKSLSLGLSQYLLPSVRAYNLVHPFQQIRVDSIRSLPPVSIYMITASSSDQEAFTQALTHFFGITAPDGYSPACVFVLELPFLQVMNALFSTSIQGPLSFPIPVIDGANLLFSAQYISTTPKGSFVLALTLSKVADSSEGWFDLLNAMARTLGTCLKMDPVDLIQDGADLLKSMVEIAGDASISVITSDLDQTGQLTSYTLLDVVHVADTLSTITTAGGIVKKTIHLLGDGTKAAATALVDVPDDVRTAIDVLDLGLEILPYLPYLSFLKNNWLYEFLSTCVSVTADFVDPNGTTVIPSVYDTEGSLVLGYNSTSSDVIYASLEGILIPNAGEWLILLNESQSSPVNYTIYLNAVGGSALVPYNIQILSSNQNASAIGYSGMVLGGTSTTISINVTPDGTLNQQVYLNPAVYVSRSGNVLNIVAKGLLSNGSLAPVSKAFLVVDGSQYEMVQDDSSTFEIQIGANLPRPIQFFVYMIALNVPGGLAVVSDNTPPTTTLAIGPPKYVDSSGNIYVLSAAPFVLSAQDNLGGTGAWLTTYRVNNGTYDSGWLTYTKPFNLTSLRDGNYTIAYNSTDNVGNVEVTHQISITLFSWNCVFEDSYGRGTVLKINTAYKFFQFIAPGKDYGIRKTSCMQICGSVIIINHCDSQLKLMTIAVNAKLDLCMAIAWDKQTGKTYYLVHKPIWQLRREQQLLD